MLGLVLHACRNVRLCNDKPPQRKVPMPIYVLVQTAEMKMLGQTGWVSLLHPPLVQEQKVVPGLVLHPRGRVADQ